MSADRVETTEPSIAGAPAAAPRPRRPNIVFFFTDDQRSDTIRELGNPEIITPNLDALARDGTAFTNAYIMGGTCGAVCMPSRAMLMSGRTLFHIQRCGEHIPRDHVTLPEHLRSLGYTTFGTGKWHNGARSHTRSFSDGAKIFFGGMSDHFQVPLHDFNPAGEYRSENVYCEDKKHSSDIFGGAAIDFLRRHDSDAPFFLYLAFTAPHDPRDTHQKYHDMYNLGRIELPENFMPAHPFDNGELRIRDELLASWPRTPDEVRRHIAEYYAMITHADAQIGAVLDALRETGHDEDTIVVFAGDNGLALGQHGLMGKQNLYEHSVRVPLIFRGPGIPRGERRDALCYLLDVYPTLCDLLGVETPGSVEGHSLGPVLLDPAAEAREVLLFAYRDIQRAVRDERFKLIEYVVRHTAKVRDELHHTVEYEEHEDRTTQLFDLETDPCELDDLSKDPAHTSRLQLLRYELERWRDEFDDWGTAFWRWY